MNKIYIGDQEINTGGGSGGGGVTDTSFNELAKVAASALIDLKGLEDNIEEFDDKIEGHVSVIDTQIQTLDANKADASVVYTKTDVDKADKVTAAALASLDSRVATLESSSGSGGSGETFDPSYLEEGLLDVSTRVVALEQIDYVETNDLSAFLTADDVSDFVTTNDISAFVTQSAFDSSYVSLDTSIKALDASALAFDASIKELASSAGGGGGGGDAAFVKYTNTSDSTKVGIVSSLRTSAPCTSIGNGALIFGEGIATGSSAASFGTGKATGNYGSFALNGGTASGGSSFAGHSATASGSRSIALGMFTTASG